MARGKCPGRFVTTLADENQKGALHKPAGKTDEPETKHKLVNNHRCGPQNFRGPGSAEIGQNVAHEFIPVGAKYRPKR